MKVPEPRRLPSGNYCIRLRLSGEEISITRPTARECRTEAQLVKAEHRAQKRTISKSSITVTQAIDKYIEDRKNTLSPSTVLGYRRIQNERFLSVKEKPLSEVNNWQALCDLEARNISPKTLRNAWGFMVSILRHNNLPVPSVTLPVGKGKARDWLEPEEITVLVKSVKNSNENAIPTLLALHALRRSEIAGLDWSNVNLKKELITVRGAVVRSEHGLVSKKANKTEESTRTIKIRIPELLEVLNKVPEAERVGRVFKYTPQTICARVNRACKDAGLTEVGTHGLRHSFASLAYHLGLSEMETMEIGGWSDPGTMRKIYQHLAQRDRLKAENKLAEFFKNGDKNGDGMQKGA